MTAAAGRPGTKPFRLPDWVAVLRTGKPLYRLGELARLAGHTRSSARRAAHRLVQRNWLAPVGKGLYANMLCAAGPPTVEDAAGILYPPAYISLSSALFEHGVAEQAPHLLTCVTTNKTKRFATGLGEIHYHQVKEDLFFGYALERGIARAHPEKAALDFVYLELRAGRQPVLDEWNWEEIDVARLRDWAERYPRTVVRLMVAAASSGVATESHAV